MISSIAPTNDRQATLLTDPKGLHYFPDWLSKNEHAELDRLSAAFETSSAGQRLFGKTLEPLLTNKGSVMKLARGLLGPNTKAIRAVFFNKTLGNNWSTPWHQDRTIPVKSKHVLNEYETWSIKDGVHHVEPPISLLENMITLKIHIDPCPVGAGPIRVAEGSHRIGRVQSAHAAKVAQSLRERVCTADAGDIWAMSNTILHASSRSTLNKQRRVLHIDFSACQLPEPLEWVPIGPK